MIGVGRWAVLVAFFLVKKEAKKLPFGKFYLLFYYPCGRRMGNLGRSLDNYTPLRAEKQELSLREAIINQGRGLHIIIQAPTGLGLARMN